MGVENDPTQSLLKQRKQQERQWPPLEESRSHIGTDLATVALREIRRYQKSLNSLSENYHFSDWCENSIGFLAKGWWTRFTATAIKALQEAAEGLLSRSL